MKKKLVVEKEIRDALEIAKRDLRECYTASGIFAGRGHFREYWARDSFFASLGANSIGDFEQSRKNLQLFLDLQKDDGLIPAVISRKLKPKYRPLKISTPVDQNALFVMAIADYARRSGDMVFVESNFKKISLAVDWLCKRDRDGDSLIEEGFLANWADTILKHGEVLYSNACYYHALKEFAFLSEALGVKMISAEYNKRAEATKLVLNLKFWQNNYYADWIGLTQHNYFDSAGNILAIVWGAATTHRSDKLEEFIEEEDLAKTPIKTNTPPYPLWKVVPLLWLTKAYYYHNGFSWPWIGCMNAMALNRIGKKEKAIELLRSLAWQINEYCVTNEVFEKNNKPVHSFWLKSEKPFAWTAGLFIRAVDEVFKLKMTKPAKIKRRTKTEEILAKMEQKVKSQREVQKSKSAKSEMLLKNQKKEKKQLGDSNELEYVIEDDTKKEKQKKWSIKGMLGIKKQKKEKQSEPEDLLEDEKLTLEDILGPRNK